MVRYEERFTNIGKWDRATKLLKRYFYRRPSKQENLFSRSYSCTWIPASVLHE